MKLTTSLAAAFLALLATTSLFFISCNKESSQSAQQNDSSFAAISTSSNIESDAVFSDVFNNVIGVNEEAAFGGTGVFARVLSADSLANQCFTVQVTRLNAPEKFPLKITIDFGTGCTGRDGIVRKGKLITVYNGPLTVPGKVAETTFDGFYISNIHVEGFHRIENTSTSQTLSFKVNVRDGKLTKFNGNYSQRTSEYTITQTEGYGTPLWLKDDVLSIRGEGNGTIKTDHNLFTWKSKTLEPLIKRFTCEWVVKGKIGIGKTTTDVAFIDYGDGTCDNKATLTINGSTIEISLH